MYVNTQQFNADFTREWFQSTKGARWKVPGSPRGRGGMEYLGENADAYRTIYEIKSNEDPAAWRSLIRMFRVLNRDRARQAGGCPRAHTRCGRRIEVPGG